MVHDQAGIFVIFGITGDLAQRYLLPALYHLEAEGQLSDRFRIIGTSRRNTSAHDVEEMLRKSLSEKETTVDNSVLESLCKRLTMVDMNIDEADEYPKLVAAITQVEQGLGSSVNRLFYLAVPPELISTIAANLAEYGLNTHSDDYENRLLIEKPFGQDLESAKQLIEQLSSSFSEDQIYRVDHYLAKETAQNILTFRFDNPLFKALWDHAAIDHVMITAAETIGVEGRANFYEQTGALRDLIQSHLLQLLALVAMEEPAENSSDGIHKAKLNLLNSVEVLDGERIATNAARGQYEGYRDEVNNQNSQTETYAALALKINNDRWQGVPILLRTGKSLAKRVTEINLVFKSHERTGVKNILTIRIQPGEGIVLNFQAKKPSLSQDREMVRMDFDYNRSFGIRKPDAYERVLADAIRGDKTLFTTDQEVIRSWEIIDPVVKAWQSKPEGLEVYKKGSWGPKSADSLAESVGANWFCTES